MLGIDVGGANLKVATDRAICHRRSFALWRHPDRLSEELASLLSELPANPRQGDDRVALTMTGELADCYASKAEGVHHIVTAVEEVVGPHPLRVYLVGGEFVPAAEARRRPLEAAASNWHAMATLAACRYAPEGSALLVDVGSTTTDVVPLVAGKVAAIGKTDPERLAVGELVYTGVERTPLFALLSRCTWGQHRCPTAPELFATALDAYLLTGSMAPEPENRATADGGPRTTEGAHARIARIVCADHTLMTMRQARQIAREFITAQRALLCKAVTSVVERLPTPMGRAIVAGQGEFVAEAVLRELGLDTKIVSLQHELGPAASRCGPAYAVAELAIAAEGW